MNLTKKNINVLYVIILASISYFTIFLIATPLWDDYTLTGSTFEELKLLFADVGFYNIGVAHFHYFLNLLNGDSVFYSRLISFVGLISLSVLFYLILDKLNQNTIQKITLSSLFILLPFFGACFTQIILPYIICFNLFLISIICLINYIERQAIIHFVLFFIFSFLSFITNSFIFFIIPVLILIWLLMKKEIKFNRNFIFILFGTFGFIILFMLFKHFFMQVNVKSSYVDYNKITLRGLLISGPKKTLLQIPNSILNLIYFGWDIIRNQANFILSFLLAIPFYLFIRKIEWNKLSFKYFLIAIISSIILMFSAIYPYAVVDKVNNSFYEYNSRFDMLLIIGMSIFLSTIILFLFSNQIIGKVVLSFLFSVMFVCKLSVFINFYYQSKLQTGFYDLYLSKLDSNQSYLIHEKNKHLVNWRFYEIGGILRGHQATENVLYTYANSNYFSNDTINKLLVQKIIQTNHFALKDFNLNNFQYKPVEFIYKEQLDVLDFIQLIFGIKPLEFKVKELTQ